MANSGFGHFKNKVSYDEINDSLLDINKNRFGDYFKILYDHSERFWVIALDDNVNFSIYFDNVNNEIEYRTETWDCLLWIQETFISLLMNKYDGTISNDGVEGEWKPDFHIRYPHMIDWYLTHLNSCKNYITYKIELAVRKKLYKRDISILPKDLISLI